MTNWKKPSDEMPPQGKKIIWFHNGDMQVVQLWGDVWCPIPFIDSEYARTHEPELWADIEAPEGYTGKVFVGVKGTNKILEVDELEMFYPEDHKNFVETMRKAWSHEKKK
jgi:hypothetical protein